MQKILLTIAIAASLHATDWPSYLGPLRNGVSQSTGLISIWPATGPEVLWRIPMGIGWSAPALSEGLLYITSMEEGPTEAVVCLNAADGKEVWRYTYPLDYGVGEKIEYFWGGPRASVTIAGPYAYAIGTMGEIFCFDKLKGNIIWQRDLNKEYPTSRRAWKGWTISPLVEDGLVVVNLGPDEKKKIERCAAFDALTGKLVWLYTSPVKIVTTMQISQTPQLAVFENEKYLLYSPYARVSALRLSDGKPLFSYQLSEGIDTVATPVFVGTRLLESPYAKEQILLEIKKVGEKYTFNEVWKTKNSPSGHAGYQECNGNLFGFASCFSLVCISVDKGSLMWSKFGFKQDASLTVADGKLFIRNANDLIIAEATDRPYKELSRYTFKVEGKPKDSTGWVAPLIVDGKLYTRFSKELMCIDVGNK